MKIQKKLTVGVLGTLMFFVLCAGTASAEYICRNAVIGELGQRPSLTTSGDNFTVALKCEGWTKFRLYYLSTDLGDSGYATLLTATSLNRNVMAWIEDWRENSIITDIMLLPSP